jgi:tRNA pseudouridine13 synthase
MPLPDWARAHGPPLFAARIRARAEDFEVTEILGWERSGEGEHDYLWVAKTGANTEWVARQLARHAGVPAKDVGYAGLKDRRAVTRQWFSVPRWNTPDWSSFAADGIEIVEIARHRKKLRRGVHRGNRFRITLRGREPGARADEIAMRIAAIRELGVPNYFGEQRFGRDGGNLELADAWASGKRLPRHKRSLAISTVRSFLFNEALDRRVRDVTWNRLQPGDKANLDGTGSVFEVPEVDEELARRCAAMDIHPAGVLAGDGTECGPGNWRAALAKARVEPGTRSLRLKVPDLEHEIANDTLILSFILGRGAFATSVLRELVETHVPDQP